MKLFSISRLEPRSFLSIVLISLLGLVLAGCQSQIKTYDSTFTSLVTLPKDSKSAKGSKSLKATSGYMPRNLGKAVKKRPARLKKPYFIEFRARSAYTYGHASVVFGMLDRRGRIPVNKKGVLKPGGIEISGLHPAGRSTVPWTVGHVVPVPAETGPSDGDFEDAYVTARYRINLTEKQFRKVVRVVAKRKRGSKVWSGPLYACTHYIKGIARDLGLKAPGGITLPKATVQALKKMNGKNPRI